MTAVLFEELAVAGVRNLQPYLPGKPVEQLERELGITDSIKLASNENPLGPSTLAIEAMQQHVAGVNVYPDGNCHEISQALASKYNLDVSCVTMGNGSNDVLDMVARAFLCPGVSAVFSEYSFAVYPIAVQATGAQANIAKALPRDHDSMPLGHDLNAMYDCIDDSTRVVFIANPNNPTGTWIEPADIERFISSVNERVVIVLDLAYYEYMDVHLRSDIAALLKCFPNLVVTHTFSKIYALAGLRIGYGLSSPAIADLLNRVRHPFNVNTLAQAAALASLQDEQHVLRSATANNLGKKQLMKGLMSMGLGVLPSMANFLSVDCERDAQAIVDRLLHAGIIVRPVANYNMPDYLRITIGTMEQNNRVLESLSEIMTGEPA